MNGAGAACAAVLLCASPAAAQFGNGGLPRTAWGDPDLQGIWNNSTITPLEQMTEAEQQRNRDARAPVIAATRGTGAAWPETGGTAGGTAVADHRSAGRPDIDDPRGRRPAGGAPGRAAPDRAESVSGRAGA